MIFNKPSLRNHLPKRLTFKKLIKKEKYVNTNPKYNRDNNCIQDIKVTNEDRLSRKILNSLVFHDVLEHLMVKMKFEQLLELSLVSKTTFNLIRSQLSFNFQHYKFNIGSFVGVRNYISDTLEKEMDDPNIYQCKLLPFREMEYIAMEFDSDQHKTEIYNDSHGYVFRQTKKFKKLFSSTCTNLKKVHILMNICAHFITAQEIDFERKSVSDQFKSSTSVEIKKKARMELIRDYSHNGFFTYETLIFNLNMTSIPVSDEQEFYEHRTYKQQPFEQPLPAFKFSFKLINKYQPRVLIIRYIPPASSSPPEEELDVQYPISVFNLINFENIFNFPSIEIVKFFDVPISKSFIRKLFTQKTCKIKKLFLTGSEVSHSIISEISLALVENKTMLKQLCLNTNSPRKIFLFQANSLQQSLLYHKFAYKDERETLDIIPNDFFENLKILTHFHSLTCMDLSSLTFNLTKLLPLKQILSLEKLKYHFRSNYDVSLLNILLEYCRDQNNEIIQLKCIFDDIKSVGDYFKAFIQFFYNYTLPDNYPPWYFTINIKIIDKSFQKKEYFIDYLELKYKLLNSSENKQINVIIK
ncbi:cyclin-like F-box containing protein [Dictyostelium discoideum AX4]|uniref:Cyclin-like F-box containing protein n=1 Tax=Dictyostelium discoideum TaxID=44689 RepID=Q54RQ6_DICDI|nr:cyclin-like F-box containing protein [Dictyostelium discoideum AX4]EAL65935.1 cyclin-like F-box containing protein [Dictyostelium discoideum AX4]|eukprot:XP_639295.1 cyclin-like F-box containing protein [Dictyostelium discoideum AX4]